MGYGGRITVAMFLACAFVVCALATAPNILRRIDAAAVRPEQVVRFDLSRLSPPPPPTVKKPDLPKRLIDAGAAAEAPVKETDLISSRASQAQDNSDKKGDPARPAAKDVDDFDQVGASKPTPPVQPEPKPAEAPSPAKPAETPPTETQKAAEKQPETPSAEKPVAPVAAASPPMKKETGTSIVPAAKPAKPETKPTEKQAEKKPAEKIAKDEPAPKPEQFKVAAAPTSPPVTQELRAEKGREGGGAERPGFTSFEANKHALGEYMLKVRDRVEREWRTSLHLKYSGVGKTAATVRCVIRPDGTIESAKIIDPGDSLTYAVLCRDAVERAGPFGPFPFDVPEIYRTENLEINWRFSYL